MPEIIAALGGTGGLTAASLLGVVVIMVLRGALIPASTHERILSVKDESIRRLSAALDRREAADAEYLELAKTSLHVIESIRAKAETTEGGEES